MRTDRITLAVTAAETAECAGLGLRLAYLAYRLSPSGILLKSNALGPVSGGVMAVIGGMPRLSDPAALAGAVTAAHMDMKAFTWILTNVRPPQNI